MRASRCLVLARCFIALAAVLIIGIGIPSGLLAQDAPPTRSPAVAGLLSGLVFPGVGSFYAGSSGHGLRHSLIAGATLAVAIPNLSNCPDIGTSDSHACSTGAIFALLSAVNYVWSIVTAVGDANEFNRTRGAAGLQLGPRVVPLGENQATPVGLELARFSF